MAVSKRGRTANCEGMSGESEHTFITVHVSVFYLGSYRAHKRPSLLLPLSYSQMIELQVFWFTENDRLCTGRVLGSWYIQSEWQLQDPTRLSRLYAGETSE